MTVYDEDGSIIGEYFADLYVQNSLIIELKAAKGLADEHVAQILGYLRASRIAHGLLMNFGAAKFEIRKYVLSQTTEHRAGGTFACFLSSVFASLALFRG